MNNLIVLEDLNHKFIKNNYINEFDHIEINTNTILTGNIIFKIFDFDLKIDLEDYEIYSINNNNDYLNNIFEILISTNNMICLYQNKLYCVKDFEEIINSLKSNKYSKEYYLFILSNKLKKNKNIFDFIDLLDLNEFHKIYKSQYNLIKYFNNKPNLPINYCLHKIKNQPNKIAKEILKNMVTILKTLEYEIHPKFFDLENSEDYDYDNTVNNDIYHLIENCIQSENYYLLLRIITIFKLHINNSEFIFILLKNKHQINKIIKLVIEKNIYKTKPLLEFLLILNKVNIFNSLYTNEKDNEKNYNIDFNYLIKYFIKYNSIVSFYFVIDTHFSEIKIDNILPNDFLKIYLNLIKTRDNYNDYLFEYFKLILNKDDNQCRIIFNEINKNKFTEKLFNDFLNLILKSQYYNYIKCIIDINKNNKIVFLSSDILFKILNNKQEELFYYIINLFEEEEKNNLFNKLKDSDNNTLYHYICKNSICLGYKINNKVRNNKGFKPLDLCTISHKYYKI
jgi:hypothetical protein